MKLIAEPFTLELRHDIKDSELILRKNLNLEWCDGLLFNVTAIKNIPLVEYDVIIWNEKEKSILFIEYKNTPKAYKNLKEKEANQKKDIAQNIARAFGFQKFNFIVVVNDLEEKAQKPKGKAKVISYKELNNYLHESNSFESAFVELDYMDRLLRKYERQENQVELEKELVLKDLEKLRTKIEQVNTK
jgi:hypothetical protein